MIASFLSILLTKFSLPSHTYPFVIALMIFNMVHFGILNLLKIRRDVNDHLTKIEETTDDTSKDVSDFIFAQVAFSRSELKEIYAKLIRIFRRNVYAGVFGILASISFDYFIS